MKMNQLLSMNLPEVREYRIGNTKGEAYVMPAEGLARFDWKGLTARPAPLNFAIAKTARAAFVEAVRGEYFARELTAIEAEAAKFAENDDAFFCRSRSARRDRKRRHLRLHPRAPRNRRRNRDGGRARSRSRAHGD